MARAAKHTAPNFEGRLRKLINDRHGWQSGYDASNNRLYQILGECLDITVEARKSETMQHQLNTALSANGYTLTKKTTLEARVIKCVFDAERRRTSVYSIVLQIAAKTGISGRDLPEWIRQYGGIEEIRVKKGRTSSGPAKSDLVALAAKSLTSSRLSGAVVSVPGGWMLNDSEQRPLTVAILKRLPDGHHEMVWAFSDKALVTSALFQYGRVLHQSQKSAQVKKSLRDRAEKTAALAAKARPIDKGGFKLPARAQKMKASKVVTKAA